MIRIIFLCIILSAYSTFSQDEPPECKNISKVPYWMNYPDSAKKYGIEGRVTIKVLIGLRGEVITTGEMTGPEVFYVEVKRISMLLKFKPAKHNGERVKCWVTIPFIFKLPEKDEDDEEN